jgi:hypothetical protein
MLSFILISVIVALAFSLCFIKVKDFQLEKEKDLFNDKFNNTRK